MRFQAPESLSEQIAQHLGQRIIVGQLKPGERIQELKVAGDLDVSRGSVREALLILERRHLIRIYPRKGAVVSELTPALVNSLYDIYISLLTMLACKVAESWSGNELAPMIQQVQRVRRLAESDEQPINEIIDAGFQVMRLCYPIVDNPFLEETLENFRPAIGRTYYLALQHSRGEAEETRSFFRELVEAAQERDGQAIRNAIERFGEHQRQRVLETLAEQETPSRAEAAS